MEGLLTSSYSKVQQHIVPFRAAVGGVGHAPADETEFFVQLKKLKEESKDESNDIRALVKEIVPTYHYADSSSIISIGRTPDMK